MIERKNKLTARIGIFAVSHSAYDEQFEGLYDNLLSYHHELTDKLKTFDVEIVDFGMTDTSDKGFKTARSINAAGVDLIICNMVTYATSSVFAPVIREVNAPMILTALQPLSHLDYNKASTFMQLENDNICSVPEFMGVAHRLGRRIYDVVIGTLHDDAAAEMELSRWCGIAKVLNSLKEARIGLLGHTMEAMYDMHTDPTAVTAAFGIHVPLLEIDDIIEVYNTVTAQEIAAINEIIECEFDMPDPVSDPITEKLTEADKRQAAKTAAALMKFTDKYNLNGLAYYYEGLKDSLQRTVATTLTVGNSILNAQGVPMCGEYDLKTCIAMMIMDKLDIGGSFAEFHPFDFDEDFILVGHDGPHHLTIANGKPILRSLKKYHGKPGSGAGVEFKIKEGPITILGITQKYDGKFKFVIGEGISKSGPIPPTGNTNTRGFFEPTTKEFVKKWVMECPTHHFALGIGHHAETIAKIADILNIEYVIVR